MKQVILVDNNDNKMAVQEKLAAHEQGNLHRAFSTFVFNDKEELLIYRRALDKYHCPGLWSNTCCSHPSPDEDIDEALHRRLKEELGFDCRLKKISTISYNFKLDN